MRPIERVERITALLMSRRLPAPIYNPIYEAVDLLTEKAGHKLIVAVIAAMDVQRIQWLGYVALVCSELNETMGIAQAHGWKSSRGEEAQQMMKRLGITRQDIEAAAILEDKPDDPR